MAHGELAELDDREDHTDYTEDGETAMASDAGRGSPEATTLSRKEPSQIAPGELDGWQ
jgi:hypothetical protein